MNTKTLAGGETEVRIGTNKRVSIRHKPNQTYLQQPPGIPQLNAVRTQQSVEFWQPVAFDSSAKAREMNLNHRPDGINCHICHQEANFRDWFGFLADNFRSSFLASMIPGQMTSRQRLK